MVICLNRGKKMLSYCKSDRDLRPVPQPTERLALYCHFARLRISCLEDSIVTISRVLLGTILFHSLLLLLPYYTNKLLELLERKPSSTENQALPGRIWRTRVGIPASLSKPQVPHICFSFCYSFANFFVSYNYNCTGINRVYHKVAHR